jgi:Tol biopolymer transport system component
VPPSGVFGDAETLRVNGRTSQEAGRVRHARVSPDGRWAAIVSASGMSVRSVSPIPTLGGARQPWRHDQHGPDRVLPMVTPDGKYLFFSRRWGATWERSAPT